MALPLVNENTSGIDRIGKDSADRLNRSAQGSFNLSSKNISLISSRKSKDDKFEAVSLGKDVSSTEVLHKLYLFVVKNSNEKKIASIQDSQEKEDFERETDNTEIGLIKSIPDIVKFKLEQEKEEGVISKLWKYFKYLSYGKMIYRNWETISKFLGLEKLTQSIKNLSDELGVTSVINNIKSTIDDIMSEFSFKSMESDLKTPTFTGPKSINAADPKRVMQAMNFFIGKGLTPEQSAGLVGNMLQENPAFATDIGGDHGKAGGLFQWQGSRQTGMGTTFESQLQHAWDEMTGKAPVRDIGSERSLEDLRKTTTPEQAAVAVQGTSRGRGLTRAGTPMIENRMRYAAGALELYKTGKTNSSTDQTQSKIEQPSKSSIQINTSQFSKGESALESVFDDKVSKINLRTPETDKHLRMDKEQSEKGELGVTDRTKTEDIALSKIGETGNWATDQDLTGITFEDHSARGNPLSYERQITKLQAKKLQELRGLLGMNSMHINSGKRLPAYNAKLRGSATNSAHLYGMACDVSTVGMDDSQRVAFVRAATKVGFGGIGIYSTFIHVDTSKVRMWKEVRVSQEMQNALDDHVKGRIGQVVDIQTGLPTQQEVGEMGTTQSGNNQTPKQSKTEQNSDFIGDLFDAYNKQRQFLSDVFTPALSGEGMQRFENMIENIVKDIPSKDRSMPDVGGLMQQNNVVVNVNQNKTNQPPVNTNAKRDVPALFITK